MTGCESDRGEWGQPCPDCGTALPARPGPLSSWKAQQPFDVKFGTVTDRRWSPEERVRRAANQVARMTERQAEVLRMVEKHGGNRHAAARELGIRSSTVFTVIGKLVQGGVAVPPGARR